MKSILLIDDDKEEYFIFLEALGMLPIELSCDHENDGETAIKKIFKKGYDYIFIDLNMPKLGGVECAERIRMTKGYSNVPIVLYSSCINENILNEAKTKGVTCHLEKAYSFKTLAENLTDFFEIHYAGDV